jgi:hypothetical protein
MREQLDNRSTPTDIIFRSASSWLLYSYVEGKITEYEGGRAVRSRKSPDLQGGICFVMLDKSIYFCDSNNGALRQLKPDYTLLRTIRATAGAGGKRFNPTDVVRANNNLYYIVDNANHRVLLMNPQDGKITNQWGRMGIDRGFMRYPFSAVVDNTNLLYVSEVLNTRVQMFAPTGRSTMEIGGWGIDPGQFFRPKGLALINNKYLIVSDGYLGVLQAFDLQGNFVGVITDASGNVRRYASPTRIRAFGDRLAVLDYYNNVFEVLSISGLK